MRSLGGSSEFSKGQGLAVVSQRVLLQLADGHRREGAGQALVRVLLTWKNIKDHEALDLIFRTIQKYYTCTARTGEHVVLETYIRRN